MLIVYCVAQHFFSPIYFHFNIKLYYFILLTDFTLDSNHFKCYTSYKSLLIYFFLIKTFKWHLFQVPLGVPSVSQLGLLTSQRPQMKQGLFASLRTNSSAFMKLVGEGFGSLIQMCPHSVQAALISMKPEPIHYVCSDGAQADTHHYNKIILQSMLEQILPDIENKHTYSFDESL